MEVFDIDLGVWRGLLCVRLHWGGICGLEYCTVEGRPMLSDFEYIYTSSLGTLVRKRVRE